MSNILDIKFYKSNKINRKQVKVYTLGLYIFLNY